MVSKLQSSLKVISQQKLSLLLLFYINLSNSHHDDTWHNEERA